MLFVRQILIFKGQRLHTDKDRVEMSQPQIYKGDSRPCILPLVMASSAMGLKLGVFRFLPTTLAKKQTQNKSRHNLRTPCRVSTHVYLHAQTAVDVGDTPDQPRLFWLQEKTEYPQFKPHAGIKMEHVLWSPVYICGIPTKFTIVACIASPTNACITIYLICACTTS